MGISLEDLTEDEKLMLCLMPENREEVVTLDEMAKLSGMPKEKVRKIFRRFMELGLIEKRGIQISFEEENKWLFDKKAIENES